MSPTRLFDDALAKDDLPVLPPDWPASFVPALLIIPSGRQRPARLRAFGDRLIAAGQT